MNIRQKQHYIGTARATSVSCAEEACSLTVSSPVVNTGSDSISPVDNFAIVSLLGWDSASA